MSNVAWVLKNKALDLWELKSALARRWIRRLMIFALAVVLGLAGYVLWDARAPSKSDWRPNRALASHAPLPDCERKLARLPSLYRIESWALPGAMQSDFGCRKEGSVEWVERWDPNNDSEVMSVKTLAKFSDGVKGMEWLDDLAWSESRSELSIRGLAESMGAAELTEASRGLRLSVKGPKANVAEWAGFAVTGWIKGALVIVYALMDQWEYLSIAFFFGIAFFAGEVFARRWALNKGQRIGVYASSFAGMLIFVMAAGPMGSSILALSYDGFRGSAGRAILVNREQGELRVGELPDCEKKLGAVAKVSEGHFFECSRQDGQMSLLAWTHPDWSGEGESAEEKLGRLFGVSNWALRKAAPLGSAQWSWRTIGELSGFKAATSASERRANKRIPEWSETGSWSAQEWRKAAGLVSQGVLGTLTIVSSVLVALMFTAIFVSWLNDFAKDASQRARAKTREWMEDPEFRARAESRELDKTASRQRSKEGAGGSGRPRL